MVEEQNQERRYPLLVRVYGVLCVLAGGLQIVEIVLVSLLIWAIVIGLARGTVTLAQVTDGLTQLDITGHSSATTLVIGAVLVLVSVALAVMFFVLGVRLLRNKHERAAMLANVMIGLEAVALVCEFMLRGLGPALVSPAVNMVILLALEVYSDPALREERRLQRRLQELEDKAAAEDGTLGRNPSGRGYITLNFFNVFWVFVICSVIGLLLEIVWHMVVVDPGVYEDRAGLLYGPFSPIYGCGAVLMTVALNRFYRANPVVIFLVAGLIGASFEYFVSWFMQTAFGIVSWDYTGTFLNINGRTNFQFFCMWGLLGLVWVRLALPVMLEWVNRIPWNWRYGLTTACTALMLVDVTLTLASFDCWYQREDDTMDYQSQSAIVAFCNEHYPDDYMANRFQSMTITPESASRA